MFGCIPVMIDTLDHRQDKVKMAQPFEARRLRCARGRPAARCPIKHACASLL